MKKFNKLKKPGKISWKLDRKKIVGNINGKFIRKGSYSLIITVIVAAILVAVNLVVGEIPSQYTEIDASGQKLYTISDETKEMLHNLDEDVELYFIAQDSNKDGTIEKLLERYEDGSSHIKVEQIDPVLHPNFTDKYTSNDLSENSIIVVCGDKNKIVNYSSMYETQMSSYGMSYETSGFDGEGQLTSAISYVTSDNLPVLYNIEGHGEAALSSSFEEAIEKANIDIQTLNLLSEGAVPDDADCILINAPTGDFSDDEKDAVIDYLENGGKALIFSDYSAEDQENFKEILRTYGVETVDGVIFEGDSQHYLSQMPYYLIPEIRSTDITSDISEKGTYVLVPVAQGIQTIDQYRDSLTIESLLSTTSSSYSKVNMESSTLEKEEGDIDGPFDVAVSIQDEIDDDTTTQIVYFSSSYITEDQVNQMVSGGNIDLVIDSLNWMCDTEDSVSIPSKDLSVSYLTWTGHAAGSWSLILIAVLPGAILIFGVVVWLRRRKQ